MGFNGANNKKNCTFANFLKFKKSTRNKMNIYKMLSSSENAFCYI